MIETYKTPMWENITQIAVQVGRLKAKSLLDLTVDI